MINKILKNLVYLFYPQNICAYTERDKYFMTEEYKRLNQIITEFDSENGQALRATMLKEFKTDYTLKDFVDSSLFDWKDRCITFNLTIIEDDELYTISLYMSVLIPYYMIKCQKNMIELFFSKSKIAELQKDNKETRKISDLILDIETIVEDKLLYKKFPKEMLNIVLQDVSFQDAGFGHFSMVNAFFNNNVIREENEN